MGKSIDKRFNELGAKQVLDLHCADEATNLEEVVESWKIKVIDKVVDIVELAQRCSESISVSIDSLANNISVTCHIAEPIRMDKKYPCVPDGMLSVYEVWNLLQLNGDISAPPNDSSLPGIGSSSSTNLVELIPDGKAASSDAVDTSESEWTVENPFLGRVISARWLSACPSASEASRIEWGKGKEVVEAKISLENSNINYQPGDSIAVCCPNPAHLVDLVIGRLNESLTVESQLTSNSMVRKTNGSVSSLGDFLSYR